MSILTEAKEVLDPLCHTSPDEFRRIIKALCLEIGHLQFLVNTNELMEGLRTGKALPMSEETRALASQMCAQRLDVESMTPEQIDEWAAGLVGCEMSDLEKKNVVQAWAKWSNPE